MGYGSVWVFPRDRYLTISHDYYYYYYFIMISTYCHILFPCFSNAEGMSCVSKHSLAVYSYYE